MVKGGNDYYNAVKAPTQNVQLPKLVPCGRCEKKKGHHCYSKKRLDDLRAHKYKTPRFDAERTPYVNCMMCSGAAAQQLELDCIGCERTLPNTRFNKTQRRNPDNARCEKCQAEHLAYEPGADSDDDDSGHECSDSSDDDLDAGGSTLAGTMSGMTLSDTFGSSSAGGVNLNNGSATGGSSAYPSAANTRAPSLSTRDKITAGSTTTTRSNWTTTTSNAATSTFNPRGYGTPPSLRSSENTSGGGKFAKVRASDAAPHTSRTGPSKKTAAVLPARGPEDDDDIGVASDDSDDD